jgi:ParB family chromosome partitioning protein
MSEHRKALGKGLSSLIPMGSRADNAHKVYFECDLGDIVANPNQPRKLFAKEAIDELASSIEEKGVIQPLVVRPLGGGKYELIAGERRYRASKQVGLERVPVVIKDVTEAETLEIALIENIQRQDLNPIEEALAYKELLSRHQYTQDELAKRVGKDRSSVANSLRLLKLPDKIRNYLINNELSMGHARALLAIENKDLQLQIADDIVKNNLSVRDIETLTQKYRDIGESAVVTEVARQVQERENHTPMALDPYHPYIKQMEDRLRSKVKIKAKGSGGQVLIAFHNEGELKNLIDKILS